MKIVRLFALLILFFLFSCKSADLFVGSEENGYLDAIRTNAKFNGIHSISLNSKGELFVSDYGNNKIRKVSIKGNVSTFLDVENPKGIIFDSKDNLYLIEEKKFIILKVTSENEASTFFEFYNQESESPNVDKMPIWKNPNTLTIDKEDSIYFSSYKISKKKGIAPYGLLWNESDFNDYIINSSNNKLYFTRFSDPTFDIYGKIVELDENKKQINFLEGKNINITSGALTFDSLGRIYFISDNRIMRSSLDGENIETLGYIKISYFNKNSIVIDNKRKILYVSDFKKNSIYKFSLEEKI